MGEAQSCLACDSKRASTGRGDERKAVPASEVGRSVLPPEEPWGLLERLPGLIGVGATRLRARVPACARARTRACTCACARAPAHAFLLLSAGKRQRARGD